MKYGKVYFLGIGGIGMSAEARYFLHEGRRVAGYDRTPSELTAELRREGAEVTYDESTDAIPAGFRSSDDTLVVYTPAIIRSCASFATAVSRSSSARGCSARFRREST